MKLAGWLFYTPTKLSHVGLSIPFICFDARIFPLAGSVLFLILQIGLLFFWSCMRNNILVCQIIHKGCSLKNEAELFSKVGVSNLSCLLNQVLQAHQWLQLWLINIQLDQVNTRNVPSFILKVHQADSIYTICTGVCFLINSFVHAMLWQCGLEQIPIFLQKLPLVAAKKGILTKLCHISLPKYPPLQRTRAATIIFSFLVLGLGCEPADKSLRTYIFRIEIKSQVMHSTVSMLTPRFVGSSASWRTEQQLLEHVKDTGYTQCARHQAHCNHNTFECTLPWICYSFHIPCNFEVLHPATEAQERNLHL